jgi:hypothetical protein
MGSYCYVPSWLVLKTNNNQGTKLATFIHNGEPPGMQRPESPSQVTGKGGRVGKIPSAHP